MEALQSTSSNQPSRSSDQPSRDRIYSILFVCLGNICRSPAAEAVMQKLATDAGVADRLVIDSAGTGDYHIGELPDYRMRDALARHGYSTRHHCRQVCDDDFSRFDLIIGMDGNNIRNLRRMAPHDGCHARICEMADFINDTGEIRVDCVPDPYYSTTSAFDNVIRQLEIGCRQLLNEIAL